MQVKTIVQFEEKEVELTNLDKDIKKALKEKGITQKEISTTYAYVKSEATYVVAEGYNGDLTEFKLYE